MKALFLALILTASFTSFSAENPTSEICEAMKQSTNRNDGGKVEVTSSSSEQEIKESSANKDI